MIQVLIFDLDDTLYPEKAFVTSGYRAVARYVAEHYDCNFDQTFSVMMSAYESLGRKKVFPALMAKFPEAPIQISEIVEVYRQHQPAIDLFPGYLALLKEFALQYRLGVITDGLPAVQERKFRALGLEDVIEKVVYSWEYGSEREKPHPFSFSLMLQSLQSEPNSALFIGDNPEKDGRGARGAGMKYAQIRHGQLQASNENIVGPSSSEFTLESLFQLPKLLQQMS
jgi:putative hydrolase of the HAD superfamily